METPQPFRISISKDIIDDLQQRLQNTRWIFPLKKDNWEYGVKPEYMEEFIDYWQHSFDWNKQEEALNKFNHFKAMIDDHKIHFIHERSKNPNAVPILLLHGWPDSFYRFHKIISMLTDPPEKNKTTSFDVIVPSLPGFGFTECPKDRTQHQVVRYDANLLWKLMTEELGYKRFIIAGGDGGSPLAQVMAIDHPQSVMSIYLTDLGWQVSSVDPSLLTKKEQKYLKESEQIFMKQGAYAMVHSTKPQTLAFSLNDSPIGLAAWILDRFHFWTDGDIEEKFSKDELLTNIMIYWATQTIGSSIRGYRFETLSPSLTTKDYVKVPVGLGLFPKDIGGTPPREFAERTLNVQHWTEMPRGGHFTAWEEPGLMAADIQQFVQNLNSKEVKKHNLLKSSALKDV